MPEGTIQDSRNPNSPQWGYLEVEKDDASGPHRDTGISDPKRPEWNRYVMFLHEIQEGTGPSTKRFIRGDRVLYDMKEAFVILPQAGIDFEEFEASLPQNVQMVRRLWVAEVKSKLS